MITIGKVIFSQILSRNYVNGDEQSILLLQFRPIIPFNSSQNYKRRKYISRLMKNREIAKRFYRIADILEQIFLPAQVLDVVLGPVGPVPDAAIEEGRVAVGDGVVPDGSIGADIALRRDPGIDNTALERVPLDEGILHQHQLVGRGIVQVSTVGEVRLEEVTALGCTVPVAVARFHHTRADALLGCGDHVVEHEVARHDAIGQPSDLVLAPTQFP